MAVIGCYGAVLSTNPLISYRQHFDFVRNISITVIFTLTFQHSLNKTAK